MDPVRIDYTISIGLVGASRKGTMTIDREEWDSLTTHEREAYINDMYDQQVSNVMDGGWTLANADLNDPTT